LRFLLFFEASTQCRNGAQASRVTASDKNLVAGGAPKIVNAGSEDVEQTLIRPLSLELNTSDLSLLSATT
jgi:hypothetical protein